LVPRISASASSCWPTVRANEGSSGAWQEDPTGHRSLTLNGAAEFWPTPDAQAINDSEEPGTWLDRREREKAKGQNGNGMGVPLAMAAKLWPTPRASENENRTTHHQPSIAEGHGRTLAGEASMWPTPGAADGDKGPMRFQRGNPSQGQASMLWATPMAMDGVKPSAGKRAADDLTHQAARWGTPRANDWKDDSMGSAPVNGFLSRQVQRHETSGPSSLPSVPTSPRRLNPAFVCWLMGWPEGWSDAGRSLAPTSFVAWGTASSAWLRALASSCSPRGLA
jgi:hypothetical protein